MEQQGEKEMDITEIMKSRAMKGFGTNISNNIQISKELKEFENLKLWSWVEKMKNLNKIENRKTYEYLYPGIETILTSTKVSNEYLADKSGKKLFSCEPPPKETLIDKFGNNSFSSDFVAEFQGFNQYESYQRKFASKICGWLDCEEEEEENSTRSFAKFIFSTKLTQAINVLTNMKNPIYKYLAFALFQYNQSTKEKFRELFQNEKLDDAYLRASIGFLSSKWNDYSCILYEKEISFSDRLSFALKYLNNDQLLNYVRSMKEQFLANGDLQGIILTGLLNPDTVTLLSNFNDFHSDIQTICILTTQLPIKDYFSKIILESYRDLLDRWSLFEERAILDISMAKFKNIEVPKVNVVCKFCNQTISNVVNSKTRSIRKYATPISNKSNSCPNCQKPLPSCSVCQMPFGTPISSIGENISQNTQNLDYTFVWCVSCKHSGHLKHLMEWFQNHKECSVPGCDCKCYEKNKIS
jgi:WD repeat-containing protein mio